MIFDSPGPYHYGELGARGGCQGVLGFRCDRVVHHVVALANLFETETSIMESSLSSGLRVKFGSEGFAGRHHRPGNPGQLVGQGDGDDAIGLPGPHGDDPFGQGAFVFVSHAQNRRASHDQHHEFGPYRGGAVRVERRTAQARGEDERQIAAASFASFLPRLT